MCADNLRSACDKAGNARDAVPPRLLPVLIHQVPERSLDQNRSSLIFRKPDTLRNVHEHFDIADVSTFHKIGTIKRLMHAFKPGLRVRPFCELLRKPAVVGVRPPFVREPLHIHEAFHSSMHSLEVEATAGKQVFQEKTF